MTEYGVTHIHPLALLATLVAGVVIVAAAALFRRCWRSRSSPA